MIKFLSSWAKNIGLAVVIASIIEMILPENNTKKYIKLVLGTYILFSVISPFIGKDIDFNLDEYIETSGEEINQESMDRRINELYKEQLEKNITSKVEEQGYIVENCSVDIEITDKVETTKINKISLDVKQGENKKTSDESIENKVVSEIQKIKEVDISKERWKFK